MMDTLFAAAVEGGALTGRTRLLGILLGLLIMVVVLELVRRRKLQERYIVLWVLAGVVTIVTCAVPDVLGVATDALGVRSTASAMQGLLIILLFVFALHTTAVISRLAEQNTRLAQELAVERAARQSQAQSDAPPQEAQRETNALL